ncbi:hypothetical protein CSC2_36570 [Clostridium zeae]|uniref:Type II toxin-antitoxin system HicB family antitoxin n=1 Tax=Clostridium zeae TaxID=2759022 RepID=A0ABQ1EED7_9CLOT|nr:hypothetical protein [Clostridium zeae]GFZ33131.1 hypothetical protein CSC2_36570 [Clostridium zeae]
MEKYKDYEIIVVKNDEKDYPYKSICRIGDKEIKHKGQSQTQAIDFVKQSIRKMELLNAL